jgi:hypothetical protein
MGVQNPFLQAQLSLGSQPVTRAFFHLFPSQQRRR